MRCDTLKTSWVSQRLRPNTHGGYQVNPQSWFSCLYKFIKTQVKHHNFKTSWVSQRLRPNTSGGYQTNLQG